MTIDMDRFDLEHHRETNKPCFIDTCKTQAYEHIPYLHGINWDNCKEVGNYPMVACIKHFKEVWAGEF